jgi:excisionase family DNA binding protein
MLHKVSEAAYQIPGGIFKMNKQPKTLSLQGLSDYVGIKRRTLYNMIKDGRFPVKPIKGTDPRLWNVEDVDAWKKRK